MSTREQTGVPMHASVPCSVCRELWLPLEAPRFLLQLSHSEGKSEALPPCVWQQRQTPLFLPHLGSALVTPMSYMNSPGWAPFFWVTVALLKLY